VLLHNDNNEASTPRPRSFAKVAAAITFVVAAAAIVFFATRPAHEQSEAGELQVVSFTDARSGAEVQHSVRNEAFGGDEFHGSADKASDVGLVKAPQVSEDLEVEDTDFDEVSGGDRIPDKFMVQSGYYSYSKIQKYGIGCPWMTSRSDSQISCADGTSGGFNYCLASGTFRTQCPSGQTACNDKAGNGDAFSCYNDCQVHGGAKPCYEPSLSTLKARLRWPFLTNGVVVKSEEDGYPGYTGSNDAESCPNKWRVPKTWFMGACPADQKRCTPFTNYSSHVAALKKKHGYGDYQCILYEGDYTNARGLWSLERADPMTMRHYKDPNRKISRRQILERALGWVSKNWMYINAARPQYSPPFPTRMWVNGKLEVLSTFSKKMKALNCMEACYEGQSDGCPQVSHGCDCCGLVAMSWRIPNCARTGDTALRIKCADLKPGDAISNANRKLTGWKWAPRPCDDRICPWGSHIVLFRKWVDPPCVVGSKFEIYQSGGGGAKMNRYVGGPHGTWLPEDNYAMRRVNLEDP